MIRMIHKYLRNTMITTRTTLLPVLRTQEVIKVGMILILFKVGDKCIDIVGFEDGLGLVNLEDGSAMCLKCQRTFSTPGQAKVHFKEIHMIDRNDRKFNCHLCSKSFAIKRYLSNHIRAIHGLSQTLLKNQYMPHQ